MRCHGFIFAYGCWWFELEHMFLIVFVCVDIFYTSIGVTDSLVS